METNSTEVFNTEDILDRNHFLGLASLSRFPGLASFKGCLDPVISPEDIIGFVLRRDWMDRLVYRILLLRKYWIFKSVTGSSVFGGIGSF